MSKTCKNCGNTFEDHMNICPRCGMQYVEDMGAPQQNFGQPQQQYQQNYQQQYQQPYQNPPMQPQYNQYGQPVQEQPMTLGQWVGTILLTTMLGTVSLILLFVWGFGSNTPTTKKNYCRAMLIIQGISMVLAIILIIVLVSIAGSIPEFASKMEEIYGF